MATAVVLLFTGLASTRAAVDYTVFSVSMNKNKVAPGDQMIATVVIKNIGSTAGGKQSVTALRFLPQSSRPIPVSGGIGTFNVDPLAAGQAVEVQVGFYVPEVADGVYYIWAICDNNSVLGQAATATDNDFARGAAITVAKPTATQPATQPTTTTGSSTTVPSSTVGTPPATTSPPATSNTGQPSTSSPSATSSGQTIVLTASNAQYAWSTDIYAYTSGIPASGAIDEKIRLGGWGDHYDGFLRFDVSGFTAPVQSAHLRLYVLTDENQTTPFTVMRITSSWTASSAVRWANQPQMVQFTQVAAPTWGSTVDIDVTELVNGWIKGDYPNFGIGFVPTRNDHAFTTFASPGNSDPTKRPQLVVVPSAAPSTTPPPSNPPVTVDPSFPQPDFSLSFYTTENPLWNSGYAPGSTNPPNPKLGPALGNCTWFSNGRERQLGYDSTELNVLIHDASTWATAAQNIGMRVDTIPEVGAIAQSTSQNHVAVVERINADGTITVSESSYVSDTASTWNFLYRTRTVAPTWFSAYIHLDKAKPAVNQPSSTPPATTTPATPSSGATPSTNTTGGANTGSSSTPGNTTPTSSNTGSSGGNVSSSTAVINTSLTTTTPPAPVVNSSKITSISTLSGTPLIAGFCITGNAPKTVVVRAIGPTLTQFGVTGVIADPILRVYDSTSHIIVENDDWGGGADLKTAFDSTGLFPLADSSKDAALLVTLQPGTYTAQIVTKGGGSGLGLLEVYEVR